MRVGGHRLREHVRLFAPLFAFVAFVWLLRIVLDEMGAPMSAVRPLSVTGAASVAVLIAVLMMHVRRFGSYPNVIIANFLLLTWGQLLIVLAILFSVVTGTENIYTAPEFSIPHDDPYHLRHIIGHLTYGIGGGVLFGSATGCLLLWLLRMLVPRPAPEES